MTVRRALPARRRVRRGPLAGVARRRRRCRRSPSTTRRAAARRGRSTSRKDGGYYQKYGLDVDLQFGVHPTGVAMLTSGQAVMVNHSLEQGMVASARDAIVRADGQLVEQGPVRADRPEGVQRSEAAEGQAHRRRRRSATRRTTTRSRCSGTSASATATCSGFRSAPTSPAGPRRCRPTAPTPRC